MNIQIIKNEKTGAIDVVIDGINFGAFDTVDKGKYSYFPKRNEQITGSHLIAIGYELNSINNVCIHGADENISCGDCMEDAEYEDIYGNHNKAEEK